MWIVLSAFWTILFINGFYNPILQFIPQLYWTVEFATWIVYPTVTLILLWSRNQLLLPELGFHTTGRLSQRSLTALVVALPLPVLLLQKAFLAFMVFVFPVNFLRVNFNYQDIVPSHGPLRFLVATYFAASAAFAEEIYFRSLPFLIFSRLKLPNAMYCIFTALTFAIVHWEQGIQGLLSAGFFGAIMATTYVIVRNIWPLVVSHFLLDFLSFYFNLSLDHIEQIIHLGGGTAPN